MYPITTPKSPRCFKIASKVYGSEVLIQVMHEAIHSQKKQLTPLYIFTLKTFKFKNAILEIAFWAKPI